MTDKELTIDKECMTNNWVFNNKPYVPSSDIKGIVYLMEYNNKKYIGKKTIYDSKNKLTNYQSYYGSSKNWLNFISNDYDNVKRTVLYECANKIEMSWWEDYMITTTLAVWNEDYFNGNLGMLINTRNSKNFRNKSKIQDLISKL